MENDAIVYLAYAVIYAVLSVLLAFAGKHLTKQLKELFVELVPPVLRRIFDPGSVVVRFLKARGINIDREQADKLLEAIADAAEEILAVPPQEVVLGEPANTKAL